MDDFGNNVVLFQEVTEPSILAVATDAIDIDGFNLNCNGGMDGTALATGIGGVPPYSFAWSDGQMQTGEQANNLAVGFYSVSITDNNGCVQTNNITLTEPTPIEFLINYIVNFFFNNFSHFILTKWSNVFPLYAKLLAHPVWVFLC